MDLFAANNITKQFSNHKALDKVSISVPEKSIFGLLGPNGAGKTTLIRIINRIIAPDEGELYFMGRKLVPNDIERIGYLPEERGLYKKMNVPVPHKCANCRYYERFHRRDGIKLYHRKCMDEGCENEFETVYSPDRPEKIYCKTCYQKEVM